MNIVFNATIGKVFTLALVALFLTGAFIVFVPRAQAASLTEPQIQAIIGLLSSFGADQSVIDNVNASLHGTATASGSTSANSGSSLSSGCNIVRTLQLGSSGSDVSCLQKMLANDPSVYPEGIVSGYFGPATERAIKRWQAAQGVVSSGDANTTGYGVVGTKTRAKLNGNICQQDAKICPDGSAVGRSGPNCTFTCPGTSEPTDPGYYYTPPTSPNGTICTQDAKICPDGSSVGRTGPNCSFVCPSSTAPSGSSGSSGSGGGSY